MPKRYKVLIIGSSGMLGKDLSKELSKDYDIIGCDILPFKNSLVSAYHSCDITDRDRIGRLISRVGANFVIHAAAMTNVDGCENNKRKAFSVNAYGARNVALGCKDAGAVMIYISTDFVFNGRKKAPYKIDDRVSPLSIYGESKLMGEKYVQKILSDYFIIRTSWLYGVNGKNFVDTIINKSKTENELKVVSDQVGSPTYTADLAKAINALLKKTERQASGICIPYGVYHVSNSGKVSWYEYARAILKIYGAKIKVLPISSKELNRPAKRPRMSVMDCSKFYKFTGFKMPHWKTALSNYILKK